jgi:hypothetical protein
MTDHQEYVATAMAMKNAVIEIAKLRTEVEQLRIALGLLTTIKPTMEIDVTDPVGMAQQIAAHVADEFERLRGAYEQERNETERWQAWIRELRGVLGELRTRLHAAGRRPEESYEMRVIDDALGWRAGDE